MNNPVIITEKTGNNLLWIGGAFALLGIGYILYKKIPVQVALSGTQTTAQSNLMALAQRLHEDIDGITFINDIELYKQAVALPEGDFLRLYNIYNEMFQSQDSETLTAAVAGEFSWLGNYSFKVVQDEFLARCAALNLP